MPLLLDADVLSDLVKKREQTSARLLEAMQAGEIVYMSPVAYYEVLRGLLHINAQRQISLLRGLSERLIWHDLSRQEWDKAAELWASCRNVGKPLADEKALDADVLIAAHALSLQAKVATRNVEHFHILDVAFEDWR